MVTPTVPSPPLHGLDRSAVSLDTQRYPQYTIDASQKHKGRQSDLVFDSFLVEPGESGRLDEETDAKGWKHQPVNKTGEAGDLEDQAQLA